MKNDKAYTQISVRCSSVWTCRFFFKGIRRENIEFFEEVMQTLHPRQRKPTKKNLIESDCGRMWNAVNVENCGR